MTRFIRSTALREYRERIDFCSEDRLPPVQINNTAFHHEISKAIRRSQRWHIMISKRVTSCGDNAGNLKDSTSNWLCELSLE